MLNAVLPKLNSEGVHGVVWAIIWNSDNRHFRSCVLDLLSAVVHRWLSKPNKTFYTFYMYAVVQYKTSISKHHFVFINSTNIENIAVFQMYQGSELFSYIPDPKNLCNQGSQRKIKTARRPICRENMSYYPYIRAQRVKHWIRFCVKNKLPWKQEKNI